MKYLLFILMPLGVFGQQHKAQPVTRDKDYSLYLFHYTKMDFAAEQYRVASNFNDKKMMDNAMKNFLWHQKKALYYAHKLDHE